MIQTKPHFGSPMKVMILLLMLAVAGCGDVPDHRDQRLVDVAQTAIVEQRKQNEWMASQSQAVVGQSQQLAKATQELVVAHKELTSHMSQQQTAIDTGRDQLQQERRELAAKLKWESTLAVLIEQAVPFAACLLPMLVCIYVIRQMGRNEPDQAVMVDLLTNELTSRQPMFRPLAEMPPAIGYQLQNDAQSDESTGPPSEPRALPF